MSRRERERQPQSLMSQIQPEEYSSLLREVKERVRASQLRALRAVNSELVSLYFDIGRLIVQRQEGTTWGRGVVKQLAADLRAEFPGVSGFFERNLWYAREFFRVYMDQEKLQPMVAEVDYAHDFLWCKGSFLGFRRSGKTRTVGARNWLGA